MSISKRVVMTSSAQSSEGKLAKRSFTYLVATERTFEYWLQVSSKTSRTSR